MQQQFSANAGLVQFSLLWLVIWLLPSEQTSLLPGLKWVWLSCFGLTLTCDILILRQHFGVSLLWESDDE